MSTIEIKHVGPIDHLDIPVPEKGGVVVLRGRNGCGKSTALNSVEGMFSKSARDTLTPQDDHRAGTVEWDDQGVTLRVGKSRTVKGKLQCDHIEGNSSIAEMVDPGIKDPIKRDEKRLQVLIRLAGVSVDSDAWLEIVGSDLAEEIEIDDLISEDIIETAGRIRRAIHKVALRHEKERDGLKSQAVALEATLDSLLGDVDIDDLDMDMDAIRDQIQSSTESKVEAITNNRHAAIQKQRMEAAKARMESVAETVDIESLIEHQEKLASEHTKQTVKVEKLKAKIIKEEAILAAMKKDFAKNNETIKNAKLQQSKMAELQEAIDEKLIEEIDLEPIQEEIDELTLSLEAARKGKQAQSLKSEIDNLNAAEEKESYRAKEFRTAARQIDTVFEKSLKDAGITQFIVHDDRLKVTTDRGKTLFDELSFGEKCAMALDTVIRNVGSSGVVPYGQEAWEGLDPTNRAKVAELARERGVIVFAAEATDGELHAETFE